MTIPRFPLLRVSVRASNSIADLEQALMRFMGTKGEPKEELDRLYANLSQRRSELYDYLMSLEIAAGIDRTVIRRFE